ncbi:MAG: phospholipase D-like domain-containing protein [Bacteriovorax sp.]|nr:phospholipase D-like domain-containing protein [Bacteriovorax sp.]
MEHNFFHLSKKNLAVFYHDGTGYHETYLNLIRNAKKTIHLQTYIFMMDSFGSLVHAELMKAAQRGVQVYVLVDSVGSRLLDQKSEMALLNSGVRYVRFNEMQIKWLYSWGRRLHHKILLVDEEVSMIGGINVMAGIDEKTHTQQLDFAIYLKGPVIVRLTQYCQMIYKKSSPQKLDFPPVVDSPPIQDGLDLKILINDWVYRRWQITRQYVHLTKKAKHEITIINSYFFPRKTFMKQLVDASKRGVRVRLILPKFSDWPNYILASEFLYAYFLRNGVEIYLWKNSILHGKLATIDESWATIGSFNLNYTSYQQNLEMNVNIYSENFTNHLKEEIEEIISNGCEKLNPKNFIDKCSLKIKFLRFFYYVILSIVANFSIGLIYQEDNNKENKFYDLLRIVGSLFFFFLGILGIILPIIPGIPFFIISFLLVYQQIISNKKKEGL